MRFQTIYLQASQAISLPILIFISDFESNIFRLEWLTRLESEGVQLATLIHPTVYVSLKAHIATGSVVLPHVIVNIERGYIINLGAVIDHGCIIEEGE